MNRTIKERIKDTSIVLFVIFLFFYFGICFVKFELLTPITAFQNISEIGRWFMYIISMLFGFGFFMADEI